MVSTLIQNNQAQSRVSLILFACPETKGHLSYSGITPISGERFTCDLIEVSRIPGKFEANLPCDVGAVQEV